MITESTTEPICAFKDCDQSVVPGSSFCGREDHNALDWLAGLQDGSASPAASSLLGYGDGTGRAVRAHAGEVRAEDAKKSGLSRISGTAIVYSTPTTVMDKFGPFREQIRPGAASHLLDTDVRLLANHEGLPLARVTSKTLKLSEDQKGVHFQADLDVANSSLAQQVVNSIRRGDLTGCSFAFLVDPSGDSWNEAMTDRQIKRFSRIDEISVVTFPAYPTTSVAARSRANELARQRALARQEQLRRQRHPIYGGLAYA